ncbi:hypothetical protein Xoosp13_197 [Xanthomonas phage Xoo-sp13]|nr:hypothetical protein Xoosp13_197 [Xanthomonas phage Xoo-sp13]
MTCIIAYVDKNGVGHMAGDSAGTAVSYHHRSDNVHPKIFKNGDMIIGYTSSFRMGQLLEHVFVPPSKSEGLTDYQYMIKQVVPEIRKTFVSGNFMKEDSKDGGSYLIIYNKKLYSIQEDFAVFERPSNFDSCGSGYVSSNVAFETMQEFNVVDQIGPKAALIKAIEITSRNNITVSGRIDYINTLGETGSNA